MGFHTSFSNRSGVLCIRHGGAAVTVHDISCRDCPLYKNPDIVRKVRLCFGRELMEHKDVVILGDALDKVVKRTGDLTIDFTDVHLETASNILDAICGKVNKIDNLRVSFNGVHPLDQSNRRLGCLTMRRGLRQFVQESIHLTHVNLGRLMVLPHELINALCRSMSLTSVSCSISGVGQDRTWALDGRIASLMDEIQQSETSKISKMRVAYAELDDIAVDICTAMKNNTKIKVFQMDVAEAREENLGGDSEDDGASILSPKVQEGLESIVANDSSMKWLYNSNTDLGSVGDETILGNNWVLLCALAINRREPNLDRRTEKRVKRWKAKMKAMLIYPELLGEWIDIISVPREDSSNLRVILHALEWLGTNQCGPGLVSFRDGTCVVPALSHGWMYTIIRKNVDVLLLNYSGG